MRAYVPLRLIASTIPSCACPDTRSRMQLLLGPRLMGKNTLNLYGVFDGHAGRRASDFCKDHLGQRVCDELAKRCVCVCVCDARDRETAYMHEWSTCVHLSSSHTSHVVYVRIGMSTGSNPVAVLLPVIVLAS